MSGSPEKGVFYTPLKTRVNLSGVKNFATFITFSQFWTGQKPPQLLY
ncbi:hypothetical protein HMPREF0201_01005 [Cedecea davisae DSM 4568]|uniref:Uncharacterized protein n=1 Tax=Cedecea davisae DSM 4568 TaxID=566551 RepID=S3J0X0_9ENTR|nr:hypothetical protein HMPREF0201_01005 [Cedecea davisae DSM 4568]